MNNAENVRYKVVSEARDAPEVRRALWNAPQVSVKVEEVSVAGEVIGFISMWSDGAYVLERRDWKERAEPDFFVEPVEAEAAYPYQQAPVELVLGRDPDSGRYPGVSFSISSRRPEVRAEAAGAARALSELFASAARAIEWMNVVLQASQAEGSAFAPKGVA